MADWSPLALWKRFLAQPNDNRGKTIFVAVLVAATCSAFVTGATVLLRPIQAANRAAETQLRLEALISAIPGMQELLAADASAKLSTVVVDLDTGMAAREVTPATLDAALQEADNYRPLDAAADIAGIGTRPRYVQIYILRRDDQVQTAIFPVIGSGYNGPIEAMIALTGDMNTIAGLAVTQQSETPGLGARIEEPTWQAGFQGTVIRDPSGAMKFAVARGPAVSSYEVDGITGASRTGRGVTQMVRFWLGPDGYGPVIEAIRRQEF
ncbi:FMN-binding protein [Pseudooceanicola sp.]|uniref:FMN-binding protein n=1 Tax=Pseudooceanicola sp. TaxID=1914328 RepID=UPI00262A6291|nr:FMN-binding protein [Pseudooceanicola sp.]MDF1855944.1 FMN-binding protein [Pseudooceanicola sp.]